jgi:hypothetical protein
MKRLLALVLAPLLILGLFATPAIAATPKAGSKCSNFGESIVSSGKKFTCLMVGSKQVWNKGIKVSGNSAKPGKFKAPIPIKIPAPQSGAITFANILDRVAEIPGASYNNIHAVMSANSPVNIPSSIYVGPTTKIDVVGGTTRINEVVGLTARLWKGFTQPSFYAMYVYNAADVPATEKKFKEDFFAKGYDYSSPEALNGLVRALSGNCQQTISPGKFSGPLVECRGADSGAYFNSSDSALRLGQTGNSTDLMITEGLVISHEYTHSVAMSQWIGSPLCKNLNNFAPGCERAGMANIGFSPCWLFEGLPNATGYAVAQNTLDKYLNVRKLLPFNQGPTTITDYTAPSLRNYLFNQVPSKCYQNGDLYSLGYSIGALTTEALIAIAGPQSVMAMFSLAAEGQDFPTAFKSVYGISWSDASTILSKVLAAEYATYGAPPR